MRFIYGRDRATYDYYHRQFQQVLYYLDEDLGAAPI